MKTPTATYLKRVLAFSLVCLFGSQSFAQEALNDIVESLRTQRAQIIEANKPTQQQLDELEARKNEIARQQSQIIAQQDKALSTVQTVVSERFLYDLLANTTIGTCKITPSVNANEYYISGVDTNNNKLSIRFQFANSDSLFKPIARLYVDPYGQLTEIFQDGYHPKFPNNRGYMAAVIRFNDAKKPVHAVFDGEVINDQMLGFSSSFNPTKLICLIKM